MSATETLTDVSEDSRRLYRQLNPVNFRRLPTLHVVKTPCPSRGERVILLCSVLKYDQSVVFLVDTLLTQSFGYFSPTGLLIFSLFLRTLTTRKITIIPTVDNNTGEYNRGTYTLDTLIVSQCTVPSVHCQLHFLPFSPDHGQWILTIHYTGSTICHSPPAHREGATFNLIYICAYLLFQMNKFWLVGPLLVRRVSLDNLTLIQRLTSLRLSPPNRQGYNVHHLTVFVQIW